MLSSVTELPSFQPLGKLEHLGLVYYSGFLGSCDISHPFCIPNPTAGFVGAECIQDTNLRATTATKLIFVTNAAAGLQTNQYIGGSRSQSSKNASTCARVSYSFSVSCLKPIGRRTDRLFVSTHACRCSQA